MKILSFYLITLLLAISSSINAGIITGPIDLSSGNWNLVENGSFEDDTAGWSSVNPNRGIFIVSNTIAAIGSQSAVTEGNNFSGYGYASKRRVSVTPGTSYILSAFFLIEELSDGRIYLDVNDTEFEQEVHGQIGISGWQFSWGEIVIPANVTYVDLRIVRDGENVKRGEYGYIDEVALTPASEFIAPLVPEPITLSLLTLGSIAILRKGYHRE